MTWRLNLDTAWGFVLVSGIGWLFDLSIFYILLTSFGMKPHLVNVISASCAAMFVFLVSQRLVFNVKKCLPIDFFFYLLYTEINIIIWAIFIDFVSKNLAFFMDIVMSAMLAKLIATPLSLLSNYFVVSRLLKTRRKR
jgi:putative flippase GtrA